MDFGDISANLPFILAIVGIFLLQFFLRRRKPEATNREIVRNMLMEVRLDNAMAEVFHSREKPRKFETVTWQRHKQKLGFLSEPLQNTISEAYMLMQDANQQIDAARKQGSDAYLSSVNTDKMRRPLARSQEGLEQWLLVNVGTKDPPPKYPGITDLLFGGRG